MVEDLTDKQLIWLMCQADPICSDCRVRVRQDKDGGFFVVGLMPNSEDVAFFAPLGGFVQTFKLKNSYGHAEEYSPLTNGNLSFRLQNRMGLSTKFDDEKKEWRVYIKDENGGIIEYVDKSLNKAIAKIVVALKFKDKLPKLPRELE